MGIGDLFRNRPAKTDASVASVVQDHLARLDRYFQSSPPYARSAPFWNRLASPAVLDWLSAAVDTRRHKGGMATEQTRGPDGPVLLTVVDSASASEIRTRFAPDGYLGHLERHGFFEAPQRGTAVAAFVIGYDPGGTAIYVDLTWFPPLDGNLYLFIVAQEILTPAEREELGI